MERGQLLLRFKWKLSERRPDQARLGLCRRGEVPRDDEGEQRQAVLSPAGPSLGSVEEPKLDYSAAVRITLQQQRMKGLLDGLHRAKIPFLYTMMVKPSNQDEEEENQIFEFDLVVGTWVDARGKDLHEARAECEQNAATLAATLSVGAPQLLGQAADEGRARRTSRRPSSCRRSRSSAR